jgi:hypothetical protein
MCQENPDMKGEVAGHWQVILDNSAQFCAESRRSLRTITDRIQGFDRLLCFCGSHWGVADLKETTMGGSDIFLRCMAFGYRIINRFVVWHKLPYFRILGRLNPRLWNLPALRYDLRRHNLYDTSSLPTIPRPPLYRRTHMPGRLLPDPFELPQPIKADALRYRRADGSYNDLSRPNMGRVCARYGRNFPFADSIPLAGFANQSPTPREISNTLMIRDPFRPAVSLNLLAAAWIQFTVHDWARHIADPDEPNRLHISLQPTDNWHDPCTRSRDMEIERTHEDETRPSPRTAEPPTFLADGTFWWEGSQVYGSDQDRQHELRSGMDGKLQFDANGRLPDDTWLPGVDVTGFMGGWWAGVSVLHNLFAKEHNAICDMLKSKYPIWAWDDDRLFETARLINAALMAKIHTVEWTPAILAMPVLKIGMESNWWGVLGERFHKKFGRVSDSDELSGIPGSHLDHYGVPFAFTEEFVSVYRLHPLIPDEYRFHSLTDSEQTFSITTFDQIQGLKTRNAITAIGMENVLYSFGLAHPGAIGLHNYPHFLRQYRPPDQRERLYDLAAVDILRDRERGVPRYNRFRELLRMPRVKSLDALNPRYAAEMAILYNNDIDQVDTMVGLFAEDPPEGFGFSDTAFRIFILMASRRLKSDRFFTTDYRSEIYTRAGMDWINDNGFETVLLRHYPTLAPAMHGLANPFQPWRNVHEPAPA